MINLTRLFLLSFFVVLFFSCLTRSAYSTSGRIVLEGIHGMIDLSFNDHDRQLIREYYGHKSKHKRLPPGLEKKGKRPPGFQKGFARHDHLPPHFMYRRSTYHRLPRELEHRLSRLPDGYLRVMIGGSVVLFDERTRVIFDVISDFD